MGNGQTHLFPNLYKEKHARDNQPRKSLKRLAEEKNERQEQWIKDKALQNKRDAEAKYERTRTAKKNKAAYIAAKENERKEKDSKDEHPSKEMRASSTSPVSSLAVPAAMSDTLPTNVGPEQMDNEIGPNGEVYCNELGLGICLKRVLGVCVENGPCVHMPTTKPTLSPTVEPTHPTAQPTYEPTTIYNCDPWQAPCKTRGFLNICDEYWPCANEGNHDSYPTDIVDVFEHNHFNHTDPHEELPEHGEEGEEQDSEESGGVKRDGKNEEG